MHPAHRLQCAHGVNTSLCRESKLRDIPARLQSHPKIRHAKPHRSEGLSRSFIAAQLHQVGRAPINQKSPPIPPIFTVERPIPRNAKKMQPTVARMAQGTLLGKKFPAPVSTLNPYQTRERKRERTSARSAISRGSRKRKAQELRG